MKGPSKRMLQVKDIVRIGQGENKPPVTVWFDRVYLQFTATDPVEDFEPKSDGKSLLDENGQPIIVQRPKNSVTSATDDATVAQILSDAIAKAAELTVDDEDYKGRSDNQRGALMAARLINDSYTLLQRARVSAEWRKANKPFNEEKATQAMVDSFIAIQKSKGKVLTPEQAREIMTAAGLL